MQKLYICSEPLPVNRNSLTLRSRLIGILTQLNSNETPKYQFEYTLGDRFPEKALQLKEFPCPTGHYANTSETKAFVQRVLDAVKSDSLDNALTNHTRLFVPDETGLNLYLCKHLPQNIIIWRDPNVEKPLNLSKLPHGVTIRKNKFGKPRTYLKPKYNMSAEQAVQLARQNSANYLRHIARFDNLTTDTELNSLEAGWNFMLDNLDKPINYEFIHDKHVGTALWDKRFVQTEAAHKPVHWKVNTQSEANKTLRVRVLKNTDSATEQAIALLAQSMRREVFTGQGITASLLAANHIMISNGAGIITLPPEKQGDLRRHFKMLCRTGDMKPIKAFIYENCIDGV
jgi:hypothetical protein